MLDATLRTLDEISHLAIAPGTPVAGVDEVGRGPLAGPVVAAAVVLPWGYENSEIKDSKKLSEKKRDTLVEIIKRDALSWAVVAVGHHRIDSINIREASRLAMSLALQRVNATIVLVDGNVSIQTTLEQHTVIKGDALVVQISAASILAKVARDAMMDTFDKRYPHYGFAQHAGYPTEAHREAITQHGPCPIHRKTFKGVKEHLTQSSTYRIPSENTPPHIFS
jgi:ribonuclease HII